MEFRLLKFGRKLHFSFERVTVVQGVNNIIDEKTWFLIWDFDDVPLATVKTDLLYVQAKYRLPAIIIINTGKPNGYHAYCFKALKSFNEVRLILADTASIDENFLALGLLRKTRETKQHYYTLRYSDLPDRSFKHECVLQSDIPPDLDYSDVNSFVNYTKRLK